jgi:phosphoribosyl-dephospho-CoA transferase
VRRHDLLTVDPAYWSSMLRDKPEFAAISLLDEWAMRGFPVILRRALPGETPNLVPTGIPLPPSQGRRHVAILLPAAAIIAVRQPLRAEEVIAAAPSSWRETLIAAGQAPGAEDGARVFGSLLWESITGFSYMTEKSDLDLLWFCSDDPFPLATAIADLEQRSPVRIDGEIVLPDGGGCHWREILDTGLPDVLVKTLTGVELRSKASLRPSPRTS